MINPSENVTTAGPHRALGVTAACCALVYLVALTGLGTNAAPGGEQPVRTPAAAGYAALACYDIAAIFVLGFAALVVSDREPGGPNRREIRLAATINAPVAVLRELYADYSGWPRVFPTITGVKLLERRGTTTVLQIDHVEGAVINELTVGQQISLWEEKRHYDGMFVTEFEPVPEGARVTVRAHIELKGPARLVRPLLGAIARRQILRAQLEPLARAARSHRAASLGRDGRPIRTGAN